MKVLHLLTSFTHGGIELWLLRMLEETKKSNFDIEFDFYCRKHTPGALNQKALDLGANVFFNPDPFSTPIGCAIGLTQLLSKRRYNIIHNHLEINGGLPQFVAGYHKIPSIFMLHSTQFPAAIKYGVVGKLYARLNMRLATRYSCYINACSAAVLKQIDSDYSLGDKPRTVTYLGVDDIVPYTQLDIETLRRELNIPDSKHIVTHIGRHEYEKNIPVLIHTAQLLLQEREDIVFLLAGNGSLHSEVKDMVSQLGLEKHFRILGMRNDIYKILSISDIFFLPSKWEGFGMVAIEASMAKIPVVASDIPGLNEAVQNGLTGILNESNDILSYAYSINLLLDNPMLRKQMGIAGYKFVQDNFTQKKSLLRLIDLYNDVMNGV